ncbi:MAG: Ig-like domain-containing protein [Acutalibacteraceae bacterium]
MMIGANPSDNITLEDQLVVSGRKAQLGIDDVNEKITLHLQGGIKVTDGGTLVIMNDRTAQAMGDMNLEIVLGESILVEDGGYLILQSVDALKNTTEDVGGIPTQRNTIVAPESKPAIVVDGGTVNVSHQTLKRSDDDASNEALIQVKSGEVSFEPSSGQSAQTGLPQFSGNSALASDKFNFELDNGDSTAPAISVEKDASVTIKTGDFSSENGTIFDLADGATLNLEGGTISNTGDKPAIHADSGATVILPEDPNAIQITTSNENGQAIDLAGGSKVQKGDTTITVGADGDSYVDNDGSIILGAGSSVTDPNGTTELPNGGSVDQDGDVTQNALPAESISLNQTSVTLYSNTTPNTVQLIADVTPDNTTDSVAWSSDNEAVATVNESGLVTAVSNGSATITATAGNVSAACTVTVTTYTSGGGSSDDDSDPTYSVTLPKNVKGGEVKTSHRYAEQGNTVTITVDPDKGYELDELTVTDSKGKELDLTDKGNGKYTFKMPGTRVEVEVSFKLVETEPEAPPLRMCPPAPTTPTR